MKKIISLFSAVFLLTVFMFSVFSGGSVAPTVVRASASDNVSGWAWSDNVGWISFNSTDCDTDKNDFIDNGVCGGDNTTTVVVPYGVKVDETTRFDTLPGTGDFSGYAWSENIGWVSFNRSDTGNPPLDEGDDPGVVDGSGIAKINWSNGKVTGWARALSAMTYDSTVPSNKCPFTDGPGRRVVNFPGGNAIFSWEGNLGNWDEWVSAPAFNPIPAGIYDVTLVSYDDVFPFPNTQTQTREQWYLKFNGGTISMDKSSNPGDVIADRPDLSNQVFQMVQANYSIPFEVTELRAYHDLWTGSVNTYGAQSIEPVCAVFDEPNKWDGWIKLGSNTGPTSWANEVVLDVTVGSPTENQFSGYAWGSEVMGWIKFDSWSGMGVKLNAVNTAPTVPTVDPQDPSNATAGVSITFTLSSTDAEGNTIKYGIDWDSTDSNDAVEEWIPLSGYVIEGVNVSATHIWSTTGTYSFNVLAEDSKGAQSGWSENTITLYDPPSIDLFKVSPDVVIAGVDTALTFDWSSTDATSCSSDFTSSGIGVSGSLTEIENLTNDTTYTLTCSNGVGGIDSATADVKIFNICNKNDSCEVGETLFNCPSDCSQIQEF